MQGTAAQSSASPQERTQLSQIHTSARIYTHIFYTFLQSIPHLIIFSPSLIFLNITAQEPGSKQESDGGTLNIKQDCVLSAKQTSCPLTPGGWEAQPLEHQHIGCSRLGAESGTCCGDGVSGCWWLPPSLEGPLPTSAACTFLLSWWWKKRKKKTKNQPTKTTKPQTKTPFYIKKIKQIV